MSEKMQLLRAYALALVGLPYRWGGDDTIDGFDCSGLVQELLAVVGMDPPGDQSSQALYDHFKKLADWNDHRCGALAFFGQTERSITHVALLIDDRHMIEAGGGGSQTTSREAAARQNAYVRVRPLKARKDLIAVLRPKYEAA